jgi:peptidoglycan/LPS O-acetylase OafA/YrhL
MVVCRIAVGPAFLPNWNDLASVVAYVGNWRRAAGHSLGGLGQSWSLAVEEQFYILWPLLLILAARRISRRSLLALILAGAAISTCARAELWIDGAGEPRVYFGTDTNAVALLIGCALAVWLHGRVVQPVSPRWAAFGIAGITGLGFVPAGWCSYVVAPSLVPWLTATVILTVVCTNGCTGPLNSQWLRLVGERSYGLYLWHCPLLWVVAPRLELSWLTTVTVLVPAAWLLTLISWRYVESPFLRMKERDPKTEFLRNALPSHSSG